MSHSPTTFLQRLQQNQVVFAPGIYDALSALVAEQSGFEALYLSGASIAYTRLGRSDVGLTTATEVADTLARITERVSLPVIVDADTGFGGLINIRHTVRGYEEAGVQAIQLEDQESPKKCGHTPNRRVVSQADAVKRIDVAVAARRSSDTLIIARTDARTGLGLSEAIERGKMFAKAGADIIFVESPESIDEFKRIGQELQGCGAWLIANMVPTGRSPELPAKQLKELGFALAIWPGAVMAVAAAATKNALRYLADHGTTAGSPVPMIDMKELHELVGFPDVWEFEKKYVE
jgi:2-methylisocitrate lyase-like PEP mutase family enzyme